MPAIAPTHTLMEHPPVPTLTPARKGAYALGDFTINTALASLSLVYTTYFLIQVAELRPVLAGLVPLIGRFLDAVTDPLMGRISDLTRWRAGRRRPYMLLGAVPFGVCFMLLWWDPGTASQSLRFAYYTAVYCGLTIFMTVLTVPYMAIQPEMALDYDERTSLNTYRNFGVMFGLFAAVGIRPLAEFFGGNAIGFSRAGLILGVLMAAPWFVVYAATFERPNFSKRTVDSGFLTSVRQAFRHQSFTRLMAAYICGRVAIDMVAAMFVLYMTYWIGRSADFEPFMLLFLVTATCALPAWLRFSRGREKAWVLQIGSIWWAAANLILLLTQPSWPRLAVFLLAPLTAVGYAVIELMPWAMLGEVVDEDDLLTGERREGVYFGIFTFIRKLAGAGAVFLLLLILDLAGYVKGAEQTETARQTIRLLTAFGPTFFLGLTILFARNYPLTRARHKDILATLAARPS